MSAKTERLHTACHLLPANHTQDSSSLNLYEFSTLIKKKSELPLYLLSMDISFLENGLISIAHLGEESIVGCV